MHIKEVTNMFWGVTLDGGKRYTQTVERSFHLSMAALEPAKVTEKKKPESIVSVMIQHEKAEFMLCTLEQGKVYQQPLDLNFTEGEEVTFFLSNNSGVVHLTGFLVEDDQYPDEFDPDMMEPSSSEEDSDEDEVPALIGGHSDEDEDSDGQQVPAGKKRKKEKEKKAKKKKMKIEDSDEDDDEEEDEDEFADFLDDEAEEDSDEDEDLDEDDDDDDEILKPKKKQKDKKKEANTPKKKGNDKKEIQTPKSTEPQSEQQGEGKKKKKKKKKKNKEGTEQTNSTETQKPQQQPKKQVLAGGVVSEEIKVGHGPLAQAGKMVHVYYTGKLQKTGQQFDSCTQGKPFRFRLGKGEVIKGWDVGVTGMKVGGKRKLIIPSQQGYGNQRQGPIPPGSTLMFEVELKAVS